MNGMETWDMKITSSLNGTMPIHDNEWAGLLLTMEEWLAAIEEAIQYVGSTQREEERAEHRPHTRYTGHTPVWHNTQITLGRLVSDFLTKIFKLTIPYGKQLTLSLLVSCSVLNILTINNILMFFLMIS